VAEGRVRPSAAPSDNAAFSPSEDDAPLRAIRERTVVPPRSSGVGRVLLSAAVAVPFGLVGGFLGARLSASARPAVSVARSAPPQAALTTPAQPQPATESEPRVPGPSLERFNTLVDRLDNIAVSVSALDGRLARLETQKPEPPAELGELRTQVAGLSTTVGELGELRGQVERLSATAGALAPLSRDVHKLDEDVLRLSGTLPTMNAEIAALRKKTDKLAAAAAPAPARERETDRAVMVAAATGAGAAEAPPALNDLEARLQSGVKLLKQSRFRDALGVFNRLELTHPDDARVWYYAALCLGFSTGQWTGGTQQLVEKGIERERAGTPSASVLDATFGDLPPTLGRDWLGEYRRRAAAAAASHEPSSAATP
jgi:hypothetical protein